MKPLWDRNKTYSTFIKANSWVKKFLPNWSSAVPMSHSRESGNPVLKQALVFSHLALVIENFLKNFQLWYMKGKITTERIGNTQLFFHPQNTQEWVLKEYEKRLNKLKI